MCLEQRRFVTINLFSINLTLGVIVANLLQS